MGVARIGQISGAVCRKEFLGDASDNPSEAWSEETVHAGQRYAARGRSGRATRTISSVAARIHRRRDNAHKEASGEGKE